MSERILVIRLGALGDLVLCFQAFAAIRAAHPKAEIALLTMPAFADFAAEMPWFDRVLADERAPGWRVDRWLELRRRIAAFAPTRVYDLQGKRRQTVLFNLLGGPLTGPDWSGAAPGCKFPRLWPPQPEMHFTDFVAAQLVAAGITQLPLVDTSWLDAPLDRFTLPERFALLVPGCAPDRLYKRWPHYAELAGRLAARGIGSVAIGTAHDRDAIRQITGAVPAVLDLSCQTSLAEVAALVRRAELVVGNDTGPTHLAAATGALVLALMSDRVNPVWSAPQGPRTGWLQGSPLAALAVDAVWAKLGLS